MKLRNIILTVLVMLFITGFSSKASAQEWRWREGYYAHHHSADAGWNKDHHYYRPWGGGIFNWGWGWGCRDYCYDNYRCDDSSYHEYMDKFYNDFYKDYKTRRPSYYRYYDDASDDRYTHHYYHNYRDRFYDDYYHRYRDNYRPEVDNNK